MASRDERVRKVVAETEAPRTRLSLATDLRGLGLTAGDTVMVHSSLSAMGYVVAGAISVVQALTDVVTDAGTIVMPSHSYYYSDPARWDEWALSKKWVDEMRNALPAFNPRVAPTTQMGQVGEVFRTWPGVMRSRHPTTSSAAWGKHAEYVTASHSYGYHHGDSSPLARVYDRDGRVLLLGVGYDRNTSFHLADHRITETPKRKGFLPVPEDGRSVWREFETAKDMSAEWLLELGAAFEATGSVTVGKVGSAEARLFSQRAAVDFAVGWLRDRYLAARQPC